MPNSTRFAVAIQVLTALALSPGKPVPSELLATSVHTNPTVIRRLLGQLAAAGLATSQLGQGGGALLAKSADMITLLDIFNAVEEPTLFHLPRQEPSKECVVGCHIREVLKDRLARVQDAVEGQLERQTLADVARDITRRQKQSV